MSPERINPEGFGSKDGRPTKPSDCYALGMVIYETISGNVPFHRHPDLTVVMKVVGGERPPRGDGFTESLWEMLEMCWVPQPNNRPSIETVLQYLEMASNSIEATPRVGEGMDEGDGWDSATNSSGGDSPNSFALGDHEQLPPIHSPQDHHLTNDPPGQGLPTNPAPFNSGDLNFERDFGRWFDPGQGTPVTPAPDIQSDLSFERDFGQWFNPVQEPPTNPTRVNPDSPSFERDFQRWLNPGDVPLGRR